MTAQPERTAANNPDWSKRILVGLALVVALVVLAFLGAAFVPRWWSHLIGRQVDGSMAVGVSLGLFYGFAFTLLPILVGRWGFHKRRPWKTWLAFAIGTVLAAAPNLMTLGIVIGTRRAAHAAERTLDVEAPGFRNASLAGAIVAVVAFLAITYLLFSRHRARERLARFRSHKEG
ncbi:MAG: permease [Gaiellaceae bacterium]